MTITLRAGDSVSLTTGKVTRNRPVKASADSRPWTSLYDNDARSLQLFFTHQASTGYRHYMEV